MRANPNIQRKAAKLAEKYQKPGIGGSDAHKPDCVGLAYTDFPEEITCETDLISQIRRKVPLEGRGSFYTKTTKIRWEKQTRSF